MRVAVLVDPGSRGYDLAVALEVFEDRSHRGLPSSTLTVHGTTPTVDLGRVVVRTDGPLDEVCADLVVVPGRAPAGAEAPEDVVETLARASACGTTIAGLCTGAFVLGAAGLLDGREATTHWRYCEALAETFPRARVLPNVLYAGGAGVWTSAGVSAGADLLLELLRRREGARVAAEVARSMVTPPHRPGTQAQFVAPLRHATPGRLEAVQQAVFAEPARAWSLGELARVARMSERTLTRAFVQETGLSPIRWLTRARLQAAQELLETTELTIEAIAHGAGFGSADLFRKHFQRHFGLAPTAHRLAMRDVGRTPVR